MTSDDRIRSLERAAAAGDVEARAALTTELVRRARGVVLLVNGTRPPGGIAVRGRRRNDPASHHRAVWAVALCSAADVFAALEGTDGATRQLVNLATGAELAFTRPHASAWVSVAPDTDPSERVRTGLAEPERRCQPRWGSCALASGHAGPHAQDGPFAGETLEDRGEDDEGW